MRWCEHPLPCSAAQHRSRAGGPHLCEHRGPVAGRSLGQGLPGAGGQEEDSWLPPPALLLGEVPAFALRGAVPGGNVLTAVPSLSR